jgi:purine catabolism regulator
MFFSSRYAVTENLRIKNLLAMDALGTSLLAGANGIERTVLWAHSCEMPSPDLWLGPNELLMTVGLAIPADEAGQVQLVRKLDTAGLAGMAIGDDELAPPLHPAMLAEADALGFPVLVTSRAVPFATLGRTVAAANSATQTQQVLTLSRLYHALLDAADRPDDFLDALGRVFTVRMTVVDVDTGVVAIPGPLTPDPAELAEFLRTYQRPAAGRLVKAGSLADGQINAWQIPSRRNALLLIEERNGYMLDSFTLVHLGQVVSIEANRRAVAHLSAAAKAREVIAAVYAGEGNLRRLEDEAAALGVMSSNLCVMVSDIADSQLLSAALSLGGIRHASLDRNGYLVSGISAADTDKACQIVGLYGVRAGLSREFSGLVGLKEAALQAQWALETIANSEQGAVRYDDAVFSVLPRTAGEANEIIQRVLAPLMSETQSSARLIETLCTYLDQDRNWNSTAEKLGIHRQTLAYRLQRIEKLTGRSLKSTRDLAEFWIARTVLRRP